MLFTYLASANFTDKDLKMFDSVFNDYCNHVSEIMFNLNN